MANAADWLAEARPIISVADEAVLLKRLVIKIMKLKIVNLLVNLFNYNVNLSKCLKIVNKNLPYWKMRNSRRIR